MNSNGKTAISTLDDESIGFVSWYAEGGEVGAIGHYCVVPLHRRKRYGKKQILMAEKQSPHHVHLIKVTTANYSFILPARRTHLSCGFTEVERSKRMHTEDWNSFIMNTHKNRAFESTPS